MVNGWKVIWFKDGKKLVRKFEGDSPKDSGAVDFGKRLQRTGSKSVRIVSQRKAFAPPKDKRQAPVLGMLWCPYCLKWVEFQETSIEGSDGTRSPILWRCPVCTISIHNYYVRKYNLDMVLRFEGRAELKSEEVIRRRLRGK